MGFENCRSKKPQLLHGKFCYLSPLSSRSVALLLTLGCTFNRYLALAVSSKIMIYWYDWSTKKLVIASFYDGV